MGSDEEEQKDEEDEEETMQNANSFQVSGRASNSSSNRPKAIILWLGDRERLLSKPDSYTGLLDLARNAFTKEFEVFDTNELTFHFVPDWRKREVELDPSAFEHIHDRAILRVVVPPTAAALGSAPPPPPGTQGNNTRRLQKRLSAAVDKKKQPHAPKRLKTEPDDDDSALMKTIDLTSSAPNSPAQYSLSAQTQALNRAAKREASSSSLSSPSPSSPDSDEIPCLPCWQALCASGHIPSCHDKRTKCRWEDGLFEASPALRRAAADLLAETAGGSAHVVAEACGRCAGAEGDFYAGVFACGGEVSGRVGGGAEGG